MAPRYAIGVQSRPSRPVPSYPLLLNIVPLLYPPMRECSRLLARVVMFPPKRGHRPSRLDGHRVPDVFKTYTNPISTDPQETFGSTSS